MRSTIPCVCLGSWYFTSLTRIWRSQLMRSSSYISSGSSSVPKSLRVRLIIFIRTDVGLVSSPTPSFQQKGVKVLHGIGSALARSTKVWTYSSSWPGGQLGNRVTPNFSIPWSRFVRSNFAAKTLRVSLDYLLCVAVIIHRSLAKVLRLSVGGARSTPLMTFGARSTRGLGLTQPLPAVTYFTLEASGTVLDSMIQDKRGNLLVVNSLQTSLFPCQFIREGSSRGVE